MAHLQLSSSPPTTLLLTSSAEVLKSQIKRRKSLRERASRGKMKMTHLKLSSSHSAATLNLKP
jgi:hypothetical protein